MNEEKIKKKINLLETCTRINWTDTDSEFVEQKMDELYYTLYELRKEANEIVTKLSLSLLTRLAKALQILFDNQDEFTSDVQEELEMWFLYENIVEKIENERELSWDELIE
ncbi:MAG: hypothetical protein GF308_21790 [Candidatus Heimdallarchaeota archaeon]|nr:hypothetical protein [Candidatus Heimdallarchaeota archaeon]